MSDTQTRRWVLAERPDGLPDGNTFTLETIDTPEVGDGQLQVGITHFSVDPGMRPSLTQASYAGALPIGAPVTSAAIGRVEKSNDAKFSEGDLVMGGFGWQERIVTKSRGVVKLNAELFAPPLTQTAAIGVLGIPGLTSYFGILDLGQFKEGQTVLISSASGPVGATAGQIVRIKGGRAVGLAGSQPKIDWLVDEAGFDSVINYRESGNLSESIRKACPDGVDIYFDNVGGEMLDAAIENMKPNGRIIISGQIAEYNKAEPRGIRNVLNFITHRLTMEGFVVLDYVRQFPEAQAALAGWIRSGDLLYREEIIEGIENAPEAFAGLFRGDNFGRRIISV
jgi:hypothetical protein